MSWFDLSQHKDTKLYKTGYFVGIVLLVLFHLELFSGGFICKQLFAKVSPPTLLTLSLSNLNIGFASVM
jgi:hypothetical protein